MPCPHPPPPFNGESFGWSQLVTAGGSHVLTGQALFTGWQPIYDPRLTWVRDLVLRSSVQYSPAVGTVPANTMPTGITETNATPQALVTPQVRLMDALAGPIRPPARRPLQADRIDGLLRRHRWRPAAGQRLHPG